MADTEAKAVQALAAILEPLIAEGLNLWRDWDDADLGVVADNVAIELVKLGITPPPHQTTTDVPTGDIL